jgi:hypothetical protein
MQMLSEGTGGSQNAGTGSARDVRILNDVFRQIRHCGRGQRGRKLAIGEAIRIMLPLVRIAGCCIILILRDGAHGLRGTVFTSRISSAQE